MIDRVTDTRPPAALTAVAVAAVPARLRDRLTSPVVLLNLVGILLVAAALAPTHVGPSTTAETAIAVVALAGWAVWALTVLSRARDVALLIGGPAAALGAGLGAPSLIAPVIAALLLVVSDPTRTIRLLAWCIAAVTLVLVGGALLHGMTLNDLTSLLAGIVLGVLGGVTRRQRRLADLQRDELIATSLAAEREAARAQLLEARGAAARDVHDVLAHSLGGLVLQLDAIEALLEHGRMDEVATRAAAARRLAGDGLSEARRAVATLRDPDTAESAWIADSALEALIAEHRTLGGELTSTGDPSLHGIDSAHRAALAAALREALVNARRHASGAAVLVALAHEPHAMVLRVENAIPAGSAVSVGGGQGLIGMRERFAALGDGSSVDAGTQGDRFVVIAHAVQS